jgi:hypothetical protein
LITCTTNQLLEGVHTMNYRSAITLKHGDVISVPGIGTKIIGAIDQIRHDRYRLRLEEKFVAAVEVDVVISTGEHRSPERPDGS